MSGSNPHIPACSCCGKPGNKVDKLIQIAEDFYICNNCVEICVNMIVKDTGLPLATRFIRGILSMEPSAYAMCQAEARKAAAADMLTAALKQVPSCEFFPMEAVKTNVIGTDNVLTAAIEAGVGQWPRPVFSEPPVP